MAHSDLTPGNAVSLSPAAIGPGNRWMDRYVAPGRVHGLLGDVGGSDAETFVRALTRLLEPAAQVAAVRGPRDEITYLADTARAHGRRLFVAVPPSPWYRRAEAVAVADLAPADPLGELLLGGEGARQCTALFLRVDQAALPSATDALRAGNETAAVALARLAVVHRPGTSWAVASWPHGGAPPLGTWTAGPDARAVAVPGARPRRVTVTRGLIWAAAVVVAAVVITATLRSGGGGTSPSSRPSAPAVAQSSGTVSDQAAPVIPEPVPPTRQLVATAYDPASGEIVLFGGIGVVSGPGGGLDVLNETWGYDGHRWTQHHPATSPTARWGAVMAWDAAASRLLLYGGTTRVGGTRTVLGDTWSWDGSTWSPAAATAVADAEAVGIAGGARGPLVLVTRNPVGPGPFQTYTWTGTDWHLEHPSAGTPSIRLLAGDPVRPLVVAVAGDPQSAAFTTWVWDGQRWAQRRLAVPDLVEESPRLATDPAHGDIVLVLGLFFIEGGIPQAGTLVWDGSAWIQHPDAVPDHLLNLFPETTDPVLSPGPGGRLLMLGGDRGDDGYRRAWTWDGAAWRPAS